ERANRTARFRDRQRGTRHARDCDTCGRDQRPRDREGTGMTRPPAKLRFASRPGDPDRWPKAADAPPTGYSAGHAITSRLTAAMLRELLDGEFPPTEGDQP